jgi:hypothetical protein
VEPELVPTRGARGHEELGWERINAHVIVYNAANGYKVNYKTGTYKRGKATCVFNDEKHEQEEHLEKEPRA